MLLGILEPEETVILSTHLIEEVAGFVGRAILIRKGKIIGDEEVLTLEEQGLTLMDYIRKVDPKAFVTVYSVSDMRYQPKIKK